MKYKLHVAYVNRPDLLKDAVESVRAIGNINVWSDGVPEPDIADVIHHSLPPIPATSVINHMIKSSWDDDVMFWMHNDAFANQGVATRFYDQVASTWQTRDDWGVFFTCYDVLCALNMEAVRKVGYWDTMFNQYTSDIDYYYRMRIANYTLLDFGPGVDHRGGASTTVRSDKMFNHRTQWRERDGFDKRYYREKWGGDPSKETYQHPFGNAHDEDGHKA